MSDALFSTIELGTTTRPGYRLHHLEVYQWGTFDKRVWRLVPDGQTALLTGDIGSGKSTLVDALTTLLLPAHKIAYNKAAGAETRERTLRSYVEGHYKTEQVESTGTLRAIGLRDHTSYSVLCGVFVNTGHDETVTLAQVFHQKDRAGQPDRFFVTADRELSVVGDFADFGSDLTALRRRLRASGAGVHTTFPEYGRVMRRLLGIRSEQAMELFHQTVSMKSVGNLNEFVRRHMLEPADADEQVRGIVAHFDDLTAAHDAVCRAREQLEVLTPLVATCDQYDAALERRTAAEQQRDAVTLFTTELRAALLDEAIDANTTALRSVRAQIAEVELDQRALGLARESLVAERAGAGGDRVASLERDAAQAGAEAEQRQARKARFDERVAQAGLPEVTDAVAFADLPGVVAVQQAQVAALRADRDGQIHGRAVRQSQLRAEVADVERELDSLGGRTSNLPAHQLDLRAQLCAHLGVDPEALPFAGELLDVADDYVQWRGAAERVLRGFALSLLVGDQHYPKVAAWVNDRRLTHRRVDGTRTGSRLVYERVSARRIRVRPAQGDDELRLADCLQVREGPFADYLRDELVRRADHRCATTLDQFREQTRAVTVEGQVKSGERHVKDDRNRVDDPRTWVLGWANERKVEALTRHLNGLETELEGVDAQLEALYAERNQARERETALARLVDYTVWADLDWQESLTRAGRAEAERSRLLAGSSRLAEIEERLVENQRETKALGALLTGHAQEVGRLEDRLDQDARDRDSARRFVAGHPDPGTARASFPALREKLGADRPSSPRECETVARDLTSSLAGVVAQAGLEMNRHTKTMLAAMHTVRDRWREATTEMDVDVDARDEYRQMHRRVADDDLPRFEQEFKRQLNTNAIRELAAFNNWLRRQADEIGTRVDRINEALGAIDYSPGRYIILLRVRTDNKEIADFRSDLRAVTDDALAPDDDQYSEQRFADVRRIIERFRGRVNRTEADKVWTRRVTDVRNWFVFSASERDRDTDAEWEHYRDSDGKSGGQKEKLAYTILAASLAYQFGLEWGATRSKDFRFAVIDEAFGRGSDASTRYALELFAKIGLQLLIVTPLQKVHVIEPYVRAIGFVDNPDGTASRLQTLTIEEYHALRDGRGTRAEPLGDR